MPAINLNKKGMSSVIQTSILIVLSIISISLVWGYIADLSSDFENQLSPTVDCITQKSRIDSACINQEGQIEVNINKALGEKINRADFSINQESFSCGSNTCQSCIFAEDETEKTIYITPNTQPTTQDTIATSINKCQIEQIQLTNC